MEWATIRAAEGQRAMPTDNPAPRAQNSRSASWAPASNKNDRPGLNQLRSSLVGARIDLLKTTAFAAVLVGLLGAMVHHSGLASADNQFAADAGAAFAGLRAGLSAHGGVLAASARARTDVLASAARARLDGAAAQMGSALKGAVKSAPVPAVVPAVKLAHHTPATPHHAAAAMPEGHVVKVAMVPRHGHAIQMAAVMPANLKPVHAPLQTSMTLDAVDKATDVIGAETSKAYYSFLQLIQDGADSLSFPALHNHAQSWVNSMMARLSTGDLSSNDPVAFVSDIFNIDSAVTAAASIMFLLVCMAMFAQIRSGLRGVNGRSSRA
jgi:hypothetical protein